MPTWVGGATTTQFRYTGREWDQESGLHYYRARYYDSFLGRFLSEDPVGFNADISCFTYASGVGSFYEADGLGSIATLTDAGGAGPYASRRCNLYCSSFR